MGVDAVCEQIRALNKQVIKWPEFIDNSGSYQPRDVIWSDSLLLLYTSGTTGLSKGVLLPHNLLYTQSERSYNWVLEQNIGENDCIYVPSPFPCSSHSVSIWLCSGASVLLVGNFLRATQTI